jgi:hypothetical protein
MTTHSNRISFSPTNVKTHIKLDNILSNHRPSVGQYATTFSRLILMMMFALAMKTAEAKVVRVVVEERVLLANGHFFGNVGQYEKIRGILSFFKYEYEDAFGFHNPLISETELGKEPAIKYTYVFGYSQPARFIAHMLMQGFHVDENERMVFDGARIHVAGGGKGGFNSRFVQTPHHPLRFGRQLYAG